MCVVYFRMLLLESPTLWNTGNGKLLMQRKTKLTLCSTLILNFSLIWISTHQAKLSANLTQLALPQTAVERKKTVDWPKHTTRERNIVMYVSHIFKPLSLNQIVCLLIYAMVPKHVSYFWIDPIEKYASMIK